MNPMIMHSEHCVDSPGLRSQASSKFMTGSSASCRSAMFQMNVDGLEWILFVEIATSFPAVQPALRLQVDPETPQQCSKLARSLIRIWQYMHLESLPS